VANVSVSLEGFGLDGWGNSPWGFGSTSLVGTGAVGTAIIAENINVNLTGIWYRAVRQCNSIWNGKCKCNWC